MIAQSGTHGHGVSTRNHMIETLAPIVLYSPPKEDVTMTTMMPNVSRSCVESLAMGCYQINLLRGGETWSGSSLRGTARSYAGRYAASRANLLDRIRSAGYLVEERRGERGRREVVISTAWDIGTTLQS